MNATEMLKSFPEKRMHNFTRTKSTLEFINALHEEMGETPVSVSSDSKLITVKWGGKSEASWFCEDVAIYFAQWFSPRFGVWCNQRIQEIMDKGFSAATKEATEYIEIQMGTETRIINEISESIPR